MFENFEGKTSNILLGIFTLIILPLTYDLHLKILENSLVFIEILTMQD